MFSSRALHIQRRAEVLNLRLLIWLRWFAIAGMTLAVFFTHFLLKVTLPLWNILLLLVFLVSVNLVSSWRLRRQNGAVDRAIVADLMVDVFALALILFMTGGAQNPFTGLFILQSIVAAFLLPPIEAGVIFLTTVAIQLWLLGHGMPIDLPMAHSHDGAKAFDLHVQGMFLSFFFSSALAVMFILGIKDNLRQRDARLERLAQQLEEEKVVLRLGLLASTAAHDIGTPLTNLAVILDDWADLGLPAPEEQKRQISLMQEAIGACRERMTHMLAMAGQRRLEAAAAVDPMVLLQDLRRDWMSAAPNVEVLIEDRRPTPSLVVADTLTTRALANLLDNAREAGAKLVKITVQDGADGRLSLIVEDDGRGFPASALRGETGRNADDPASNGLGLVLVRSALRRMGGRLSLANRAEGGARVEVGLPVVPHG